MGSLRKNPARQCLRIEFSAYVLVCTGLITVGWIQGHVSGVAVLATWALVGFALALAVRGIYRKRR